LLLCELTNTFSDEVNEEEFYAEGGISALVDLLLEDNEPLKVEALNALINIAVSGAIDFILELVFCKCSHKPTQNKEARILSKRES
jgi:hypothetical protein